VGTHGLCAPAECQAEAIQTCTTHPVGFPVTCPLSTPSILIGFARIGGAGTAANRAAYGARRFGGSLRAIGGWHLRTGAAFPPPPKKGVGLWLATAICFADAPKLRAGTWGYLNLGSGLWLANVRAEVDRLNELHIGLLAKAGVKLVRGWRSLRRTPDHCGDAGGGIIPRQLRASGSGGRWAVAPFARPSPAPSWVGER